MSVITDEQWETFRKGAIPENYLFLEPHPTLKFTWLVNGEDPTWSARMERAVTRFGTVSVWDYEKFVAECAIQGFEPIFLDDPDAYFEWRDNILLRTPPVSVQSKLEGRLNREGEPLKLINGFLPFQATGINFMQASDRSVYFQWSTGTGKTIAAEGTILQKRNEGFDLTLFVVKPSNLYNTARKLYEHTGLDSYVLTGTPKKREQMYVEIDEEIDDSEMPGQPIVILNAEKFRDDKEMIKTLVEDRRVLVIFDEMPEKYSNRLTALYRATAEVFYTSFTTNNGKEIFYPKTGEERTAEVFFVGMCATPIRNDPEGWFNCVRMMDSRVYGSIENFYNLFVAGRDRYHKICKWKNLDLMGAMAAHIVHQADKRKDPAIAAQFPEVLPPEIDYCDIDPTTEKLYSVLQKEFKSLGAVIDFDEILAAIGCFQMLCNNPRAVLDSAKKYEAYLSDRNELQVEMSFEGVSRVEMRARLKEYDRKCKEGSEVAHKLRMLVDDDAKFTDRDSKGNVTAAKLVKLRERIEEHDDKLIIFTSMNEMSIPYIAEWLDEWGYTYVTYHGGMTAKEKQQAQDEFRTDPDIQIFLGTDAGKDSIDLPEADLTIHYDEPWSWAGKEQRENRQHRIDSEKQSVQTITLRIPFTIESRKAQVIATKRGFHEQVFDGVIADQAEELTKADFQYILFGD